MPHRRGGWYRQLVLLFAFLFLMLYVGLEVGYGGFIFSYAVKVRVLSCKRCLCRLVCFVRRAARCCCHSSCKAGPLTSARRIAWCRWHRTRPHT